MRLKPIMLVSLKFPDRIGKLIPRNNLTLLTGLPGCGKSYSLLKFLNSVGIEPILFNLDQDASLSTFMLQGEIIDKPTVSRFLEDKYTDLKNEVIVFDTYQILNEMQDLKSIASQEKFTKTLLDIAHSREITIIVIGHPENFVGSSSIFKDNQSLVRNCYEHLHIDKIVDKRKQTLTPEYYLYINKGRGIGGASVIKNWMR